MDENEIREIHVGLWVLEVDEFCKAIEKTCLDFSLRPEPYPSAVGVLRTVGIIRIFTTESSAADPRNDTAGAVEGTSESVDSRIVDRGGTADSGSLLAPGRMENDDDRSGKLLGQDDKPVVAPVIDTRSPTNCYPEPRERT